MMFDSNLLRKSFVMEITSEYFLYRISSYLEKKK